jgi:hypothetical protein
MNDQPTWSDSLRSELDQRRIDFLTADLQVCFTFAKVAATELKIGDPEAASTAIGHAEKGYKTIRRFLTDPKHTNHLTPDQARGFKAELKRLRKTLDGLHGDATA